MLFSKGLIETDVSQGQNFENIFKTGLGSPSHALKT